MFGVSLCMLVCSMCVRCRLRVVCCVSVVFVMCFVLFLVYVFRCMCLISVSAFVQGCLFGMRRVFF